MLRISPCSPVKRILLAKQESSIMLYITLTIAHYPQMTKAISYPMMRMMLSIRTQAILPGGSKESASVFATKNGSPLPKCFFLGEGEGVRVFLVALIQTFWYKFPPCNLFQKQLIQRLIESEKNGQEMSNNWQKAYGRE